MPGRLEGGGLLEEKKKEQPLKIHGSALVRVATHARQVGGWWPAWALQERADHWVAPRRAPSRATTT